MELLEYYLENRHPIIVAVNTADLAYWDNENEVVDHAVVVAGMDEATISIYDPWFLEAPKVVEKIKFESAWLYREYAMAVIERSA